MDERLILLMILYFYFLLKGTLGTFAEQNWSAIKARKILLYLVVNLLTPALILALYIELGSSPLPNFLSQFNGIWGSYPLLSYSGSLIVYLLTVISLALSYFTWPFEENHKIVIKTLFRLVMIVFILDLAEYLVSPHLKSSGAQA